ncbi:MAG: hypothetical protein US45_C0025G0012 [Candidatus Nomurabacteria bacterium GW2011_GWA1_37_20]|uniref:Uncharacterized protein n=1 Tax=Candidatus Nomurabacteria bacterium GW2011_GWA1_37_20 TaxID=1618729 RepID=A0A0G0J6M0_9BACT|nr:MAG: hypothetical protein US45_C0025G0012 [Candidatus Nomurabacteria bacterium GW2011_GWA1_37_20]
MKNMEKEPKIEKSPEEKLRERGFYIKKEQLPEDEPMQCEKCMKEDDFKFHAEGWFAEGEFYCEKHKADILNVLQQINEDAKRRKLEEERIIEERRKKSGLQ